MLYNVGETILVKAKIKKRSEEEGKVYHSIE
jgi:hypothetical protein